MEKGYVILVDSKLKSGEQTVLVSVDKKLLGWIDEQVQTGKYHDRSQLIERALLESKRACLKAKEQK
jgi:Arc/MetJ-type ribon-helix-helix transcriptional regulator